MNVPIIVGTLLAFIAIAVVLWFVLHAEKPRACVARFLDMGNTPHLTFYHSLDSPESQRFEFEWETLKQATTLANYNVQFSLINVDVVREFTGKTTPSVEFTTRKDAKPERYTGALTSEALLAFLKQKLPSC